MKVRKFYAPGPWGISAECVLACDYDALIAAAGKVTCHNCRALGFSPSNVGLRGRGCPDCADLRALLPGEQS